MDILFKTSGAIAFVFCAFAFLLGNGQMGVVTLALGIGLWAFGAAIKKNRPENEDDFRERQRQQALANPQRPTSSIPRAPHPANESNAKKDTQALFEATTRVLANVKRWQKYKVHVDAILATEQRDQHVASWINDIVTEIDDITEQFDATVEDLFNLSATQENHQTDAENILDSYAEQFRAALAQFGGHQAKIDAADVVSAKVDVPIIGRAEIIYANANGDQTTRTLNIVEVFEDEDDGGIRRHYFKAFEPDETKILTFRADRVLKAVDPVTHYSIPVFTSFLKGL